MTARTPPMLPDEVREADGRAEMADYADALDHIARVARASRVTSKRLTWIATRAESALAGNDDWRTAPVPKNGISEVLRTKQLLADARDRAERAEALLREAAAMLHPDTDEHKRINAHLSENSRVRT